MQTSFTDKNSFFFHFSQFFFESRISKKQQNCLKTKGKEAKKQQHTHNI